MAARSAPVKSTFILRAVRIPHTNAVALAMVMFAIGVWLWIVHDFSFHYDEWDFVLHQPSDVQAYFAPHNEHWSTIPILIYQFLLSTAGMRSHLPYMLMLLLFHGATSFLLFRIVRRRAGDLLAVGAAAVLLALGWGAENFMWAFQVSWQASAVAGLLAIDLLDSPGWSWMRGASVSVLLILCLASSGAGLAFVAVAAVELTLDATRRTRLIALLLPIAVYLVWYLVIGRSHVQPFGLSSTALGHLGQYVLFGFGAGVTALSGIGNGLGSSLNWVALIPLSLFLLFALWRRPDARVFGPLAGPVVLLGLAGAVRVERFGVEEAGASRYIYMVAIFLLLFGCTAVARLPSGSTTRAPLALLVALVLLGNLWAATGPLGNYSGATRVALVAIAVLLALGCVATARLSWNRATVTGLGLLTVLSIAGNSRGAMAQATIFDHVTRATYVDLRVLNAIRGTPNLNLAASPDRILMPQLTVGAFFAAEDNLGSPVPASDLPSLTRSDPALVSAVLTSVLIPLSSGR